MDHEQTPERTATDEMIEANRQPAPIAPVTRDESQTEPGGLPPGQSDDDRSPLDPVFFDPRSRNR
jgi:hypothetical protein